jgi:hypothetical protein
LKKKTCRWKEDTQPDGDLIYETSCGKAWEFAEGTISDNEVTYCPFCGGEIIETFSGGKGGISKT